MWRGGTSREWTEKERKGMKPVNRQGRNCRVLCSHPVAVTFPPLFFFIATSPPVPVLVPVPISSLYASGIAADCATSPHHSRFFLFVIARFSIMAATSPPLSSPSLSSNAHFSSQYTNGHLPAKPHVSDVSSSPPPNKHHPASIASTPEVQINGRPRQSRPSTSSASTHTQEDMTWGSHFWVTLVDPQASFTLNPSILLLRWV